MAFGFIGLGILTILNGDVIGGIWITFIGWFLQNAAAAGHAEANVRQMLANVTVGQTMTRDCSRIQRDWSLDHVVREEVLGAGRRCFVVAEDGRLAGLLSVHEIKTIPKDRWAAVTVGETMTPADKVIVVDPRTDLMAALEKMDDANIAQMPVVDAGRLIGMIGREQILHYVRVRAERGV